MQEDRVPFFHVAQIYSVMDTLSALGSSSSVKSLATSMAIGGALAGFDEVMNVSVSPDKARMPALTKD